MVRLKVLTAIFNMGVTEAELGRGYVCKMEDGTTIMIPFAEPDCIMPGDCLVLEGNKVTIPGTSKSLSYEMV